MVEPRERSMVLKRKKEETHSRFRLKCFSVCEKWKKETQENDMSVVPFLSSSRRATAAIHLCWAAFSEFLSHIYIYISFEFKCTLEENQNTRGVRREQKCCMQIKPQNSKTDILQRKLVAKGSNCANATVCFQTFNYVGWEYVTYIHVWIKILNSEGVAVQFQILQLQNSLFCFVILRCGVVPFWIRQVWLCDFQFRIFRAMTVPFAILNSAGVTVVSFLPLSQMNLRSSSQLRSFQSPRGHMTTQSSAARSSGIASAQRVYLSAKNKNKKITKYPPHILCCISVQG